MNPAQPTVYTAASTSTAGCTSTGTILVNPVFCCTQGTEIAFTATNNIAPGVYSLNHPLTITADMNMAGVTIFMGSNAEIILANDVRLLMRAVHLLGCPNMWKGIRALGPKATIITTSNVMIEDAITAIDVKAVTSPRTGQSLILDVQNVVFNKNYTGIDIENYSAAGDYPSTLRNNVFTCRQLTTPAHCTYLGQCPVTFNWPTQGSADLKNTNYNPLPFLITLGVGVSVADEFTDASGNLYPSTMLGIPLSNNFSRQGIYLNAVGTTNTTTPTFNGFVLNGGSTYGTLNLFDNMNYGIYATNSNVSSSNAAYQEMKQHFIGYLANSKIGLYDGGIGIYSENTNLGPTVNPSPNKLTVLPSSGLNNYDRSGNFFFNNPYGIKTANIAYTDIEWAMLHSKQVYPSPIPPVGGSVPPGGYGIFMQSVDFRDVQVKHNIGSNLSNALVFYADYKPFLFGTQLQYVGAVNLNENLLQADYSGTMAGGTSMAQAIVLDNLVNCNSCQAIMGNASAGVNADHNTIRQVFNGIKSSNWQRQSVSARGNTISLANASASPSSFQVGIRHENNLKDNIISNTVTGFGTGKTTVSAIASKDNKGQTNTCNNTSATYEGFTFTGAQNLTYWRGNTMHQHIRGMHLKNTVIGQQGATGDPMGNIWQTPSSWSLANPQTYVTNSAGLLFPANTSKLYVSNGATTKPQFNGALAGGTEYRIGITVLPTNGYNHYACPAPPPFGGGNGGGVFGNPSGLMVPQITDALVQIVSDSIPYLNFIPSLQQNGKRAVHSLLTQEPALAGSSPVLQNFMAQNAASNLATLQAVEDALVNGNHSTAQSMNSALAPQTNVEANTQTFYDLYIKAKNGSYSGADDSTLLTLANGCPDRDGLVVYQARVLYNAFHGIFVNFEDQCALPDASRKGAGMASITAAEREVYNPIRVYPNPNNGSFIIDAKEAGLNAMQLKVYDVHGRVVYAQEVKDLSEGRYKLDLDVKNGIYILEVTDPINEVQYRQKLIINP